MFNFKTNTEFDIIGMGEVMLRLSSPDRETISGGDSFIKNAGGSELNVVSGASMLGARGGFITKIPYSKLGLYIRNKIRGGNVSDDYVLYDDCDDKRLGIYFYECGAYPRKTSVLYDRRKSSMCSLGINEIDEKVFSDTKIFHISSITFALDERLREVCFDVLEQFKANGTKISFDVNYREKLWSEEEAKRVVEKILPYTDYLFVSEETSRRMLGRSGNMVDIMRSYCEEYGCLAVASTKRTVISPTCHNFTSLIYADGILYDDKPYDKIEIIDRVGSGDAYVAGVLYGFLAERDINTALQYGNALSAMKNTVIGDIPGFSLDEVQRVVKAHRELNDITEMDR